MRSSVQFCISRTGGLNLGWGLDVVTAVNMPVVAFRVVTPGTLAAGDQISSEKVFHIREVSGSNLGPEIGCP
jgi:hypothetical protein